MKNWAFGGLSGLLTCAGSFASRAYSCNLESTIPPPLHPTFNHLDSGGPVLEIAANDLEQLDKQEKKLNYSKLPTEAVKDLRRFSAKFEIALAKSLAKGQNDIRFLIYQLRVEPIMTSAGTRAGSHKVLLGTFKKAVTSRIALVNDLEKFGKEDLKDVKDWTCKNGKMMTDEYSKEIKRRELVTDESSSKEVDAYIRQAGRIADAVDVSCREILLDSIIVAEVVTAMKDECEMLKAAIDGWGKKLKQVEGLSRNVVQAMEKQYLYYGEKWMEATVYFCEMVAFIVLQKEALGLGLVLMPTL
ncbi:hypothetical protein FMUND_7593 [Fusarium mundagurra]|uniref:Uncharacterized protein n=1 Tax=Fusarium mundagurra TaxID=1567541 RepID=A0A8H5YM59_9HYPO|nr:hypothetical protein FMUND_7593 [Fusarium mundagurra]